jgi:L-ascorbate metabolism protein UlaG (beta-lactamase superfamily)
VRKVRSVLVVLAGLVASGGCAPIVPKDADVVRVGAEEFSVIPIAHGTLALAHEGELVLVDPVGRLFRRSIDYGTISPTLILVTDEHTDHFDVDAIVRLLGDGTRVITPSGLSASVPTSLGLANGESTSVGGISVEAVAMYNHDGVYHAKGRGNGYVITWDDARIYVAGDTACTPEMRALEDIDIAFLPMNPPYTMPPAEAAECARAFGPDVLYPYHYRGQEPTDLRYAVQGGAIDVRVRDWY